MGDSPKCPHGCDSEARSDVPGWWMCGSTKAMQSPHCGLKSKIRELTEREVKLNEIFGTYERKLDAAREREFNMRNELRQQSALLAECVGVMERYVAHDGDCGINCMGITKCDCGFDQTLAALKSRIAALTAFD